MAHMTYVLINLFFMGSGVSSFTYSPISSAETEENVTGSYAYQLQLASSFPDVSPSNAYTVVEGESLSVNLADSDCKSAIQDINDAVTAYSICIIQYSATSDVCRNCVNHFNRAQDVCSRDFSTVTDDYGQQCQHRLEITEGISVINDAKQYVTTTWNDMNCTACFSSVSTGKTWNETDLFFDLFRRLTVCIQENSQFTINVKPFSAVNVTANLTICRDCRAQYISLNRQYELIQELSGNLNICSDIANLMNYTRILWRQVFQCNPPKAYILPLLLVSGFLACLPPTFYIAAYLNGSDISKRLIHEKRLRTYSTVLNNSACQ